MHYIGIDLGGTSIKGAVVTEGGTILKEASCPTQRESGPEHVAREIAGLITALAEGYDPQAIGGVGVGCPGIVEDHSGIVRYSANLHWENFDLRAAVQKYSGYTVRLANDANAAALGEVVAGCAQNVDSAVILTLGTGVGSGVVLNGKILTGCTGGAAELGHMVVEDGGAPCACGRKGCFETYASATGLIRMAKEAMAQHPESLLHATAAEVGDVNGQTIFRAKEQGDPTAVAVVERYIHYLSVGIANVINCFYPEVVALSGGIANQGEALLAPLREAVAPQVYGNQYLQTHTRILGCTPGSSARPCCPLPYDRIIICQKPPRACREARPGRFFVCFYYRFKIEWAFFGSLVTCSSASWPRQHPKAAERHPPTAPSSRSGPPSCSPPAFPAVRPGKPASAGSASESCRLPR